MDGALNAVTTDEIKLTVGKKNIYVSGDERIIIFKSQIKEKSSMPKPDPSLETQ